jgi:hypothetical protein
MHCQEDSASDEHNESDGLQQSIADVDDIHQRKNVQSCYNQQHHAHQDSGTSVHAWAPSLAVITGVEGKPLDQPTAY